MTVRALMDAFVYYSGGEIRISHDEWPADHPLVVERPELFEEVPEKRGPGRPRKVPSDE